MSEKERGRKLYIEGSPSASKKASLFPSYQFESEESANGDSSLQVQISEGPRTFYDTDEVNISLGFSSRTTLTVTAASHTYF